MKINKIVFIVLLITLVSPLVAYALSFDVDTSKAPEIINNDYYTAGETVILHSTVNGDMAAAGGKIAIESPVSQDLALVGGNISLDSEIGDDVRMAGGDLSINSIIKGDLIVAGGNIRISEKGFVGGDFIFGGGNIVIDGQMNGNMIGAGGQVLINNEIKGNVRLIGVDQVHFGPKGKVMGDFTYRSRQPSAEVTEKTVLGKINHTAREIPIKKGDIRHILLSILAGFSIFGLLALLFSGLILLWLLRNLLIYSALRGYEKNFGSLGIGFLAVFVAPIAILIIMITGIGLPLSFAFLLAWFLLLFLGKVVGVFAVGLRLVSADNKSSFLRIYGAFALGAFIYTILGLIPVAGWILRLLLCIFGVGALVLYGMDLSKTMKKKKLA